MSYEKQLSTLPWVEQLEDMTARPGRMQLKLSGRQAWSEASGNGICVAIVLGAEELSKIWTDKVSLLLAASRITLDHSLLMEQGCFWLCRRYACGLNSEQWEQELSQQLALAKFLLGAVDATPRPAIDNADMGKLA